jgi:hypothetical protein
MRDIEDGGEDGRCDANGAVRWLERWSRAGPCSLRHREPASTVELSALVGVTMTVADWAALAITVGWAVTAFLVVHVITRRRPDGRRQRADQADPGRAEASDGDDAD